MDSENIGPTNAELEQYCQLHQGPDQWAVRKLFLRKNWDQFPGEHRRRLITLSQCFLNIHVLGCSYPAKVMAEVERLAEGLETTKPKKVKKPNFVKIDFVKATPLSNSFSLLEAKDEEDSEVAPECEDSRKKTEGRIAPLENDKRGIKQLLETSQMDVDLPAEDVDLPRCGFGLKKTTAPRRGSDAASSKLRAIKNDYAKRLGFVKSSEVNEGFEFGKAVVVAAAKTSGSSQFQFGFDDQSKKQTLAKEFTFGNGLKKAMKPSEDLQQRFENATLTENGANDRKKSKLSDESDHSEALAALETARNSLRNCSPPLAQARIEFVMLQVNFATQGKVKAHKSGNEHSLFYEGVLLAKAPTEAEAYGDLLAKILSPQPWRISVRGSQPLLEVGHSQQCNTSPHLRAQTSGSDETVPNVPNSEKASASSSATSRAAVRSKTSTQNRGTAKSASRLKVSTRTEIVRNLRAVRKTFSTAGFKNKIEMLGGVDQDPNAALNMAFQMAALKPVREAEVATGSCRSHFSLVGNLHECELRVHGVHMTKATAGSKHDAKKLAALNLLAILNSNQELAIDFEKGDNRLSAIGGRCRDPRPSDTSPRNPPLQAAAAASKNFNAEGLFLIKTDANVSNVTSIFDKTIHANELSPALYIYSHEGDEDLCRVKLSGKHPIEFEGRDKTKSLARHNAICLALNTLIATCPTIVAGAISQDAKEFMRETMPLGSRSHAVNEGLNRRISDDNMGYRLLKRMGWSGGSLSGASGLIEPIMLKDNAGNSGLGYEEAGGVSKRFKANIFSTLRTFLRETDVFQELKFSPTFSNVERKEIHSIAHRLGLRSKSSDRPEGRVLCVSHNIDWKMILERLKKHGGSLGKFQLLPPGSWSVSL